MTIIKKFDTEQSNKKASKKFIVPLGAILIVLIIVEIWVNNTLFSYGGKLQNISTLETALKMENQIIENDVAKHTSLTDVASESAKLGFSKVDNIQYIR